jgi:hypothetical protein
MPGEQQKPDQLAADTQTALNTIGARGSERELEQQLLFFSRRCRELAAELDVRAAVIAAKDQTIVTQEAELTELRARAGAGGRAAVRGK